jgi:hypothetical protein
MMEQRIWLVEADINKGMTVVSRVNRRENQRSFEGLASRL